MRQQGVRRLVCVSSSAADPGIETDGGLFFNRVLVPMITHTIGKTTYADQRRMEKLVMDSDVDWTIVRPSGLFEAPAVTDYRITEGQTNREVHLQQRPGRLLAPARWRRWLCAQDTGTGNRLRAAAPAQAAVERGAQPQGGLSWRFSPRPAPAS